MNGIRTRKFNVYENKINGLNWKEYFKRKKVLEVIKIWYMIILFFREKILVEKRGSVFDYF